MRFLNNVQFTFNVFNRVLCALYIVYIDNKTNQLQKQRCWNKYHQIIIDKVRHSIQLFYLFVWEIINKEVLCVEWTLKHETLTIGHWTLSIQRWAHWPLNTLHPGQSECRMHIETLNELIIELSTDCVLCVRRYRRRKKAMQLNWECEINCLISLALRSCVGFILVSFQIDWFGGTLNRKIKWNGNLNCVRIRNRIALNLLMLQLKIDIIAPIMIWVISQISFVGIH